MGLDKTLKDKLSKELYEQVMDAMGDDFNWDVVPRSRLNAVIAERNDLRKLVPSQPIEPQDPPLNAPTASSSTGRANSGFSNSSTGSSNSDEIVAQLKSDYEKQLSDLKIQYQAIDTLRAAGILDPEVLWSSNVFDKTKITLDKKGKLTGLQEAIEGLKESKPHWFQATSGSIPTGTGFGGVPNNTKNFGVTDKASFLKLSADQQLAYKQQNPAAFQILMNT